MNLNINLHLTSSRVLAFVCRYVALPLLALVSALSTSAHAFGDIRQPNLEYVESNVDLKVKVLGGFVQIKRTWGNGRWYLNPSWADLRFTYDPLDNSVKSIERAGSPFEKSGNGIYIFDRQFFIKREADAANATTGWRWYDRRGNYVTYNTLGKITGYGDRNEVKVSFVYSSDGKLSTVNDHFGAVALTYTYTGDLLTKITDRGGRSVQYAYTGTGAAARLTTVTDAAGYAWTYAYNADGQITSVTDPETRTWTITYLSSVATPGGSLSVSGAAKSSGGTFATVGKSGSVDIPATASALGGFAGAQSGNPAINPIGNGVDGARSLSSSSFTKITGTALASSGGSSSGGQKIARVGKVVDPLNFETLYSIDFDRVARAYTTTAKYPGGRRTEQTYDIEGRMLGAEVGIRKTAQLNRITPFEEETMDERGLVTKSLYDAARNLLKVTYPDGSSVTNAYDANYSLPLTRIDEAGVKTVYEYDAKGNLTKMTEAQGLPEQRVTSFTYDAYGQNLTMKVEAKTASGSLPATPEAITTYTYDTLGNAASVTNAEGNKTEYLDFDARGLVTKMKDPRGNTSTTSYNPLGWKLSDVNALGHTWTHSYDKVGNRLTSSDPKNNITRYKYSLRNELTEISDPLGGLITYEYDGEGRKVGDMDAGTPSGRVSRRHTFDGDGRPLTSTDGSGNVTTRIYGGTGDGLNGLLKAIVFPTYTEEYKYDNRNRLVQVTQILDSSNKNTAFKEYDSRGNLAAILDPLGRKTTMEYDGLNRMTKIVDALAGITQKAFDTRGNVVLVTDALGSQTRYEFDRTDRVLKEVRALGGFKSNVYDANSNLISSVNAKGETRIFVYDAADRRTNEQHFANGIAPSNLLGNASNAARTILYTHDERGLLVGYSDSGDINFPTIATANSASYTYDSKGQKLTEAITIQVGGTAQSPVSITKVGTSTYYANGLKATYAYPSITGNSSAPSGSVTYSYDINRQLKKVVTPNNQVIEITGYKWTSPTQKIMPGVVVNMAYDGQLRATRIASQAINSLFTTGANAGQIHVPGTALAPTGIVIYDSRFSYNATSKIVKRDTEHGNYTYGYDDLDRLIQVVPPTDISSSITLPAENYSYDAAHNRKSSLHQTGTLTNAWTYNGDHQLTQWGDPNAAANNNVAQPKVVQTFDANGHLISKTVTPQDNSSNGVRSGKQNHRYIYSSSERLVRITDGSGSNAGEGLEIASYAYNPFGQRIKKIVSQNPSGSNSVQIGTNLYFYSDEGLSTETDDMGNILISYGWKPNALWGTSPIFKRDHANQSGTPTNGQNAVEHYFHNDQFGTPQRLTNQAGEITWRAYSEAFGKVSVDTSISPINSGTTSNRLRFPGQYEDEETATRYNYIRTYSPNVGRYIESDPGGLIGGINMYAYALNDPLRNFDIFGYCTSFGYQKTGEGAEHRFVNDDKKILDRVWLPKFIYGKPACDETDFTPDFNPGGRIPKPSKWIPPCLPKFKKAYFDYWERAFKQFTRRYEEGFFLVVCDPQWCGDDGIRKTFYNRPIHDWKEDFRKVTGYDWVFVGYEGDDNEKP